MQIASKVFGAKVFAVIGDLAGEEKLKELGAAHVVSYHSEHLAEDILNVNGGPVDSVLDVVGDALFDTSLRVLKKRREVLYLGICRWTADKSGFSDIVFKTYHHVRFGAGD
ncbi:zinc-binding dehydrogenase [[Bacillus] enclensis]|uniref:zinc-binding dehydrogenase n=1 Tax=[Bacillus] enclensis TaxID=1402860 RepID=UPI002AA528F5